MGLITDTLFLSLVGTSGGAIYFDSSSEDLEITKCIFSKCTANSGGAFYVNSPKLVASFSCASECGAGIDSFCRTYNSAEMTMHQFSSITVRRTDCTFFARNYYGVQKNSYVNFSDIMVASYSFTESDYSKSTDFQYCMLSMGVCGHICLYNYRSDTEFRTSMTNIIKSKSPERYGVICTYYTNMKVTNCVIKYNSDTLFHVVSSGNFIISDCYISHQYNTGVNLNGNQLIVTEIHSFQFFETANCFYGIIHNPTHSFDKSIHLISLLMAIFMFLSE